MKKTNSPSTPSPGTLANAAAKARLTPAALIAVRTWLAEQLMAQEFAKLGQGGHTQTQVPLCRVFIDLPVTNSLSAVPRQSQRLLFLGKLLSSEPLNLRIACKLRSGGTLSTPDNTDDEELDIRESREPDFGGTLLIGGPGQGKSTLGQLACQLHRAALLKPMENDLPSLQRELVRSFESTPSQQPNHQPIISLPQSPFLPLQIALPDFVAWLAKEQTSLASDTTPALLRFLAALPSAKTSGINADNLLALASHMPTLLVLDGFDEVGATQDRERLVAAARELLFALAHQGAYAQVIATTRPQGYAGELAQIGVPLHARYLAPLLRNEALEYARKLVEAKILGADHQTKALERLHEAASESATERLLTTPLQVTILTALVQQLGRVPRERWNLFSRYFTYTYEREIERGTYASRLLADHRAHIEQIHARVALLLQVEAERAGGASARMPRMRLEEVIEAVLSEDEVSETERKDLVLEIAKAAEQRLVFLVEPEPGNFGFEIRSLQEFMAAWALTSGRDSEVEARLLQVSKAPMFRNTALFVASRLFSEGSPLRDVLANRVCSSLDDDPDDELAQLTHAGGVLALEALEEGAVLSQPKHARALMLRATGLLSLPPGNEHTRLARVANSDTSSVLLNAIEQSINGPQNERKFDAQSAWICLIEATNRGDQWAMEFGDKFWPRLVEPTTLIGACTRLGIPLGQWIAAKIQSAAEYYPPEHLVEFNEISTVPELSTNWVSWLAVIYGNESRWSRRDIRSLDYILPLVDKKYFAKLEEPINSVEPPPWRAWINAARFEIDPNARHLASALEAIADTLPKSRWEILQWRSSWPMAACLGAADTPKDLRRIAAQLLSGELGNTKEWRSAEKAWRENKDLLAVLDNLIDGEPWSSETLKLAPPFFAVHVWMFAEMAQRYKSTAKPAAKPAAMLEKLNRLFNENRTKSMRVRLATVSLLVMRKLTAKTAKDNLTLNLTKWLTEIPSGVGLLVPRPKCIPRAEWLSLLDANPLPSDLWWIDLDEILESLAEAKAHPVHLRLAVLALALYAKHNSIHPQITPAHFDKAAETLNKHQSSLSAARSDLAILRVLIGSHPAEIDAELFQDIAVVAVDEPSLWVSLLGALRYSRLPSPRISVLLTKAYVEMGSKHPQASIAIQQLRDTLQKRKSDLDNHTMWNRLALPLPYPQMPLLPRLTGGIPSRPVRLESLELKDVCGLHHLKLAFKSSSDDKGQWVVILGPNGIGKTTLLRSLVLALRSVKDPSIWPKGAFANAWQRVCGINEVQVAESRITVKLGDGVEHSTLIRPNGSASITQLPEQDRPRLFPLFAYGCRRGSALGGNAREVNLKDDDGPEVATLFDESADLIHAETWLIGLEGDAPKNPRSRVIFDSVIGAMKALLELEEIEVADRKVWVTERGRPRLPFDALSDGYLTSAGWFLDLIARWIMLAERNNETIGTDFLAQMRGLVLIDEIDLHLHPLWQIEIIARTRRLLPQMSFVVTTHNPLTLVGVKADEIWVLSTEDGRIKATCGVEAPMLLTGGQIYRSYFGIDDIYPDGLGRSLQRYSFLSGYALRNDAEQAELDDLCVQLREAGLDPGWDVVSRTKNQPELPVLPTPKRSTSKQRKGVE